METTINKEAFPWGGMQIDYQTALRARVTDDHSLNTYQRSQLQAYIAQLGQADQERLYRTIRSVAGAGIGAAIARFLMNAGFTGTVLSGLAGGLIGSAMGRTSRMNPQLTNMFGQPYF